MATEWHYSKNRETHGPVSTSELRDLAEHGELLPTDLIWKDGLDAWVPASKVKDLVFRTASSGPPRLPQQKPNPLIAPTEAAATPANVTSVVALPFWKRPILPGLGHKGFEITSVVALQFWKRLASDWLINRLKECGLVFLGIPLGYALSYYLQPGRFRFGNSFGDYVAYARWILVGIPERVRIVNTNAHLQIESARLTAWIGIGVGVAIMGAILILMAHRRRSSSAGSPPNTK